MMLTFPKIEARIQLLAVLVFDAPLYVVSLESHQ